ncbi:MAG TPA: long-chain fatty acid--CoA ligase [Candidatus Aminicenantes bacterium]|nr:long-chain fatty acid--CoA ligase [Candidatus Aminicenantes bacterium]
MVETLSQLLLNTLKRYPKDDFMLYKEGTKYVPLSTREFGERVRFLSLGLWDLGLRRGDKLALLSENRPEWVMMDFAVQCLGALTVPIYTTLVAEHARYIIDDSDAKIVVYSTPEQGRKIDTVKDRLGGVSHYVTFAADAPSGVMTLAEVQEIGRKVDRENPGLFEDLAAAVRPEDEASIIYTSGTTGLPKGVILTHSNFLSNITTVSGIIEFSDQDTVLSFLPLSHVLERMVTFTYVYKGCSIGYAESVETVAQNLLEIKPHIMVSVPRVFEKIYSKVMDTILSSSALKRRIFFWALKVGKAYGALKINGQPVPKCLQLRRNIAHKLVFAKIIERTGGRVRFFVSGGAPLSRDIAEFFYAMGLIILEGYGLTETSPVISVNTLDFMRFGTVGKTLPGVEVKIAADGEILTRGPNVMKGYYKKDAETRDAFDDGWFKTGDIGRVDDDGFLVITDRKKDLIVTSGGKNVAPQPIENILKTVPYIQTAVVIGDRKRFVSALIVPDFEKLEDYAKAAGIAFSDRRDLVRNEQVVNFIKSEVDRSTTSLASYEKIKRIALLDREFEIEKDEITPSLKVKRNNIENRYKELIDAIYREEQGESSGNG